MSKVAKLVYYSFVTRVVVDANATDEEIVTESKRMILEKVNNELNDNLVDIVYDEECPIGTFEDDL